MPKRIVDVPEQCQCVERPAVGEYVNVAGDCGRDVAIEQRGFVRGDVGHGAKEYRNTLGTMPFLQPVRNAARNRIGLVPLVAHAQQLSVRRPVALAHFERRCGAREDLAPAGHSYRGKLRRRIAAERDSGERALEDRAQESQLYRAEILRLVDEGEAMARAQLRRKNGFGLEQRAGRDDGVALGHASVFLHELDVGLVELAQDFREVDLPAVLPVQFLRRGVEGVVIKCLGGR